MTANHGDGTALFATESSSATKHVPNRDSPSSVAVVSPSPTKVHKRHSDMHTMESGTTSDEESAVLPRRTTSHRSDGDASSAVATPESNKDHSSQKDSWFDRFFLLGCIAAWYIIGVLAIVTTKLLLKEYHVPPLVLTMQQLFVGSFLLRLVVIGRDGSLHPWPWNDEQNHIKEHHEDENDGSVEQMKRTGMRCLHGRWRNHLNFLLVGIFNSLDFLFSNSAFDQSAASFVETIKASDPITTTAIALLWKVDRLGVTEAGALILLIAGVLMSTYGDSQTTTPSQRILQDDATDTALRDSIFTAVVVMAANLCFGFRAMNQKKFRSAEKQPMDDVNLYCRMTQIGATFLCVPFLFFYAPSLLETVSEQPIEVKLTYFKMATLNSISYVTYNLASTYVLSKLTVLHHSSLNCLRRMFCILATSLYFHHPMNLTAVSGLMTSFFGFTAFTWSRNKRLKRTLSKHHK